MPEPIEDSPAKALMRLPWRRRPLLFWRLFRDPRVPWPARLVLPGVGLYLLTPLDLIPDFIPVIGQLDDLLVVALGMWLFLKLCPEEVFRKHVSQLLEEAAARKTSAG